MRVCSDTSPLYTLARVNLLHVLWDQHPEILIPEEVWAELSRMSHRESRELLEDARATGRLRVLALQNNALKDSLLTVLDEGESAAIALAVESHADLLLLDETDGRKVASEYKLRVTGVLGLLIKARRLGKIPSLSQAILRLRNEARFYVSSVLEKAALRSVGELP